MRMYSLLLSTVNSCISLRAREITVNHPMQQVYKQVLSPSAINCIHLLLSADNTKSKEEKEEEESNNRTQENRKLSNQAERWIHHINKNGANDIKLFVSRVNFGTIPNDFLVGIINKHEGATKVTQITPSLQKKLV